MEHSEINRELVYWLLFEIYTYSESVSRQTINKKFCLHFTDKTDTDVSDALKFLINANVVAVVDEEKEIIRITPQGGQVIQKLFNQFILDKTDLDFFIRYNNGVAANYPKNFREYNQSDQDKITKKLRAALHNIKEFLVYLDTIRTFSPQVKDLYELIRDVLK